MNFDSSAENWDTDKRIKRAEIIASEIHKSIRIKKSRSALEFGCGTGLISFNLYRYFKNIDLLDSSKGMIKRLEDKISADKISNMKAVHMDLTSEKIWKSTYDVIYSSMALHHIKDVNSLINKFSNMLNENGQLCIVDLNEVSEAFHKEESDFTGHHGFNIQELNGILHSNDFSSIKVKTFFFDIKKTGMEEIPYSLFIMTAEKTIK